MLLPCGKFRLASASHTLHSRLDRHRILNTVLHTLYSADRIGMPLADAFAPECIGASLRQDRLRIQTVQREHSRIPAYGYDPDLLPCFRCFVYILEILRNPCMCIKAVDGIKIRRDLRAHHRQIRRRTAAQHHNVNLVLHRQHIVHMLYRSALCVYLHRRRVAPCKYCLQLHIFIAGNGKLHAPSDIPISNDPDSYLLHKIISFLFLICQGFPCIQSPAAEAGHPCRHGCPARCFAEMISRSRLLPASPSQAS